MENMNKYTESMNSIVTSLKDGSVRTDQSSVSGSSSAVRMTKWTKPAKVLTCLGEMTLAMFIKQIETWSKIN